MVKTNTFSVSFRIYKNTILAHIISYPCQIRFDMFIKIENSLMFLFQTLIIALSRYFINHIKVNLQCFIIK